MKKILIPLVSLLLCFSVLWIWTDGYTSFTIFSYTLNEAGQVPRTFPDIEMVNQNGKEFNIKDKHKYILVNFVYLDCPNVCHKVNNDIESIYHLFNANTVPSRLEFVTVSFDLKNDNVNKIKMYRSLFGNDISGWTFALPYNQNQGDFNQFLHKVGVWAYRVPQGGLINHSVYLFLVSPDNKIVRIFDPATENDHSIFEQIHQCIDQKEIASSY